jgi:uncharacterized protein (DUF983 family)
MTRRLAAVLLCRCPRCLRDSIFRPGLIGALGAMNGACPACGLVFLREAGYFTGAMYLSYGFGAILILPIALVLAIGFEWPLWAVFTVMVVETLLAFPLLFRYSRAVWLHADQIIDPR